MHNTKEKILAVATKIFSRYGFYKTSMDEIAPLWRAFATRATTFKNPECFGKGTSLIRVCNPNVSDKAILNRQAKEVGIANPDQQGLLIR